MLMSCTQRLSGADCELDDDECRNGACQNGATCSESGTASSVSVGTFWCVCVAGFDGSMCDCDVDECGHLESSVDAVLVSPDTHRCTCVAGYGNGVCSDGQAGVQRRCLYLRWR